MKVSISTVNVIFGKYSIKSVNGAINNNIGFINSTPPTNAVSTNTDKPFSFDDLKKVYDALRVDKETVKYYSEIEKIRLKVYSYILSIKDKDINEIRYLLNGYCMNEFQMTLDEVNKKYLGNAL